MGSQVSGKSILFVGCGSGLEMNAFSREVSDALTVGVDVDRTVLIKGATDNPYLVLADGQALPFRDEVFDFCYCYHMLEHVHNPSKCVNEMNRLLQSNGGLFIATPNRGRFIGYVGAAQPVSFFEIIRRNLNEWLARLNGNFSPEEGYHCGFYREELESLLAVFSRVFCLSAKYTFYITRGSSVEPLVKLFMQFRILQRFLPSHTFYCSKGQSK
jgi:SAM-dependent methyltransferase